MAKESLIRYAYFVASEEVSGVELKLKEMQLKVKQVHGVPCLALKNVKRTAFLVAPEVWNDICNRQGSWYRASRQAGKYLAVSPLPIPGKSGVVISPSNVEPESLPTEEEIGALASSEAYLKNRPEGWENFTPDEIRRLAKFNGRPLPVEVTDEQIIRGFTKLFVYHCANHANFIEPRFFIKENGQNAPHSIAPTEKVCSACAELFDLVGSEWKVKYIIPCPGAVILAGLPADGFMKVEKI